MQTITLDKKSYVVIPREEYERLSRLAHLPALPEPDEHGRYPALEYARVSLSRKIILARLAAGLSQRELARRAGIRFETVCRIETGRNSPKIETIEQIDRVLSDAEKPRKAKGSKKNGNAPKS